ncbi:F-box/WD-40 repeat-containing protein At3g52030 isoform X1 [Magnolia sinica]|uniref:F-box/WD-40 repeat-containing protein At3g52030 isoform X1 n=1 Tax=Magnolia sinica TaxID=86752 RepID=UPI00265A9BBC|nr:F-box/WD-40 repeat-containing protein At3g52030 isoform X1 [Magnolia sinica]
MEASSVRASPRKANSRLAASIQSLDADLLCKIFASLDHFDLVRCSAVCKSWNYAVWTSSLLKDLFCKKHRGSTGLCSVSVPWETSLKTCLEEFAMNQHRSSLLNGSVEAHRWNSHTVGVNQCRMKMGSIVTGVGDKVLRMWSSESYKCLGEYSIPNMASLVDFDFEESKIVGLVGTRICIWRCHGKRSMFPSKEGTFSRGLCMRYIDPEAVIGCEDGTARVFDMYSQRCSRIIRMHSGPITCLALTDELILSGSSLGSITVAGLSSDQRVACLKSSTAPTGIRSLCFNPRSHLVFAGSTAGYSHCWDLRTMRPLWERRISPNVIYSMQYMQNDTSTLVVGGIDGVLRILDQNTGKFLAGYVMDKSTTAVTPSCSRLGTVEKKKVKALPEDACIDGTPRHLRPPITCVGVGMKKVVTTHNGKYIMMWKFKN